MDNRHIVNLIEKSIELELGVAAIYHLFSELFPEDADFWSQLHLEEKGHATLLRAAMDSFSKRGIIPDDLLASSIEAVLRMNKKIAALLDQCKTTPPARHGAFSIAIDLERDTGEDHYNQFMGKRPESAIEAVFQQLNRGDKDHEKRIREYFIDCQET